jgi:hypothetical protein
MEKERDTVCKHGEIKRLSGVATGMPHLHRMSFVFVVNYQKVQISLSQPNEGLSLLRSFKASFLNNY